MKKDNIERFDNFTKLEKRGPCGACQRPLTKNHYAWPGKSGLYRHLICSRCYEILQMQEKERRSYLKERIETTVPHLNYKVCQLCKERKLEGIRTFYVKGKGAYICTACLDRANLSASEKWKLNLNEMLTKEKLDK